MEFIVSLKEGPFMKFLGCVKTQVVLLDLSEVGAGCVIRNHMNHTRHRCFFMRLAACELDDLPKI